MAAEPLTLQEGADLVVQAIPGPGEPLAAHAPSSPVAQKTESNRLQRRFDKLTRTVHEQRERADRLEVQYREVVAFNSKLAQENSELRLQVAQLEAGLRRALNLNDTLRQRLRQRIQKPPVTPELMKGTR